MESSSIPGVASRRYADGEGGSSARLGAVLDRRLIQNLHVEALRRADAHADRAPHVLFQASTIAALLEGAYDGDLTFAELAEHGDLGLGTFNGLDGEMIALDGAFTARTWTATCTRLRPRHARRSRSWCASKAAVDVETTALAQQLEGAGPTCAVRFDGEFELVRARSVPRQHPPYRPLAEVAAEQHVFELRDVSGTIVGFRFPDYASGVELAGYHLHFITDDRRRGGHVLDYSARGGRLRIDPSSDLHVELPPAWSSGRGTWTARRWSGSSAASSPAPARSPSAAPRRCPRRSEDLGVAVEAAHGVLLDVAVAAVDLTASSAARIASRRSSARPGRRSG